MYRAFLTLQLTSLFWYRRAADTVGRLKILQALDVVWTMVGWGLNCCQSTVSAGRRYNSSTRDHTPPYWRAADTMVHSDARTSFLCTLVYRRAADTIGFRQSTMLGINYASADTLSSTADTLIPLVQASSLYLHTRIRKICGLAVHALRYPS